MSDAKNDFKDLWMPWQQEIGKYAYPKTSYFGGAPSQTAPTSICDLYKLPTPCKRREAAEKEKWAKLFPKGDQVYQAVYHDFATPTVQPDPIFPSGITDTADLTQSTEVFMDPFIKSLDDVFKEDSTFWKTLKKKG